MIYLSTTLSLLHHLSPASPLPLLQHHPSLPLPVGPTALLLPVEADPHPSPCSPWEEEEEGVAFDCVVGSWGVEGR